MIAEDLTDAVVSRVRTSASRWREADGRARQCVLDWLGVALASDGAPGSEIALGERAERGATHLLSGEVLATAEAAQLNSMQAHQLDFDDFHLDVPGHASAPVIGAALATAEHADASLAALLRGVIVGIEASTTLGRTVGDALFERGWHPTAAFGSVGAASASSVVLGFDERRLRNAIGLAALQASGSMVGFGSIGKSWQVGCAARSGIHAANAAATLQGRLPDHLGGRFGVLSLMLGREAPEAAEHSDLSANDTQFKYYSTCFGTHAAIDATRALKDAAKLEPDDIVEIRVGVGRAFEHVVINPTPTTSLEAKFSVSAVVALSLMGRPPVVPDFFSEDVASSRQYRRLEQAVTAFANDDIRGGGAIVEVTLTDGRVLRRHQTESAPETVEGAWERLIEKFVANATPVIGGGRAIDVAEVVRIAPDDLPVREIVAALTGRPTSEQNGAFL